MQVGDSLRERVVAAAESELKKSGKVTAFDVLMRLGWLFQGHIQHWELGREWLPNIERVMQSKRERRRQVLKIFQAWGEGQGLAKTAAEYYPRVRNPQGELAATADQDSEMEVLYRLTFISPNLNARQATTVRKTLTKKPEILVFESYREGECGECGARIDEGELLLLERESTLCLSCAELDRLVFLPSGDTAMTRRAKKYSPRSAVVLRHNRRQRRQERIGLLISAEALAQAEQECLADADVRERQRERAEVRRQKLDVVFVERMMAAIWQHYPKCPKATAKAVAEHTCVRGSGRVGRSAAGREFEARAVKLAVRAHIRHQHTDYDNLLFRLEDRDAARQAVADKVDAVECKWGRLFL